MVSINAGLLALSIFLGICACGLALLGISNIRSGLRRGSQEHVMQVTASWHKQPKVLFGINNIVFSLILVFALLLILLTSQTAQYIVIGLIVSTLAISVILVVLTMKAAIGAIQHIARQQKQQEE